MKPLPLPPLLKVRGFAENTYLTPNPSPKGEGLCEDYGASPQPLS